MVTLVLLINTHTIDTPNHIQITVLVLFREPERHDQHNKFKSLVSYIVFIGISGDPNKHSWARYLDNAEVHLEPCRASMVECFW